MHLRRLPREEPAHDGSLRGLGEQLAGRDGGQSWATKGPGIPSFPILFPSPVAALRIDPRDSSVLYASVDPVGVLRSTDGGLSWTLLRGGLPSGVLETAGPLAIDLSQPDLLFLGTSDRGVYRLRQ